MDEEMTIPDDVEFFIPSRFTEQDEPGFCARPSGFIEAAGGKYFLINPRWKYEKLIAPHRRDVELCPGDEVRFVRIHRTNGAIDGEEVRLVFVLSDGEPGFERRLP